ncbi:MAG: hypothetical protein EOO02_25250 [Chitinophagaceae bacterium]|nr:MAG: hypothetical protein EOO02_25250 [Chitinophagaceae bacterium]
MKDLFQQEDGMTTMSWVLLVLLIDVAHVYSTLYRTYFDPVSYKERKALLLAIPFVGFIVGMLIYSISPLMFWRILAYVAVFHFIRQQYGFLRIYSRREKQSESSRLIDSVTIYSATIYPIIYWHLSGPKNFNWFVEGDFIYADLPWLRSILGVVFFAILVLYLIKEIFVITKTRHFNIPKNLVVLGTSLSWYFGIVYYNGDLTFTLLNVVSHGIPYMALIWLHGRDLCCFTHYFCFR